MAEKKHPYRDIEGGVVSAAHMIDYPIRRMRHVVILGSGASKAAFPDVEATGRKVALFPDLVDCAGLSDVIPPGELSQAKLNFEAWYSDSYEANPDSPVLKRTAELLVDYFSEMSLPDKPTLYDHLLLCLRETDLVATFNWDPFLFDAWERNRYSVPVPEIVHLHGNVRVGFCYECEVPGNVRRVCPTCHQRLTPSRILYPVKKKDYQSDPFIRSEWDRLDKYIEDLFTLTIFGYGAPTTDFEAHSLLQRAWDKAGAHELRTITVVDKKEREQGIMPWSSFSLPQRFHYCQDFYSSFIALMPRRSCERIYAPTVHGYMAQDDPLPRELGFSDLYKWLESRVKAERS